MNHPFIFIQESRIDGYSICINSRVSDFLSSRGVWNPENRENLARNGHRCCSLPHGDPLQYNVYIVKPNITRNDEGSISFAFFAVLMVFGYFRLNRKQRRHSKKLSICVLTVVWCPRSNRKPERRSENASKRMRFFVATVFWCRLNQKPTKHSEKHPP